MRILIISAFLFSISAMACPDLSGQYKTCKSLITGDVTSGPTITQNLSNKVTTFSITNAANGPTEESTEVIIADGVLRAQEQRDPESGVVLRQTIKASCKGTILTIDITLSAQGEMLANLKARMSRIGSQMSTITTGVAMGESTNENQVCE